jgi:hypothetical protein
VARALIVGCGCHGRALAAELGWRGWQVRGTSRTEEGRGEIEAAGFDAVVADPDRPGPILEACADVAVVVWLLGEASGDAKNLAAIHGPRLESLLEKLVDSPVRGFAYELPARGSGRAAVERAHETWRIPVAFLEGSRARDGWAAEAAATVAALLEAR